MDYTNYTRQRAAELGLDPNLAHALMMAESGGNPNAVSPVGALGLLQLMPGTAKQLGVDPRDPYQNIDGGLRYLKQNIDKFGVAGGLAAYNAGPGRVVATNDFNALPAETRNYVPKVMNMAADIAEKQGNTAPKTLDIPTLMSGLEKAKAAQDADSVKEINGLLMQKYQGALQKAQAANDADAVQEITNAMKMFGPEMQPAPDTPMARGRPTMQNDPRMVDPNAPAPKGVPVPAQGVERGLGLGTRSVLKGLTSIDYPVRAAFDAIGVIPNLLGYKDAANYIHNNLGTGGSAGGSMADLAGLPTPQTRTEKAISGATEGATGLLTGGAIQKGVKAATGAVSPILEAIAPSAGSLKEAGAISGIQGAVEAAPEVAVPLLATAMGVKGAKNATNALLDARAEKKLFENSKTPGADASVILRLDRLKNDPIRYQQFLDDQAVLGRENAKGIGTDLRKEVSSLMKQGGIQDPEITQLLGKKNITTSDINGLPDTPEGRAAAAALLIGARADAMTKPVQANRITAPLRAAADYVFPKRVAEGVNTFLGGRTTGEQAINNLTSERNVAAATRYLEKNGSPTTDINRFQTAMEKAMADRQAVAAERQAAREADNAAIKGLLTSENVTPRSGPLRNLDAGFNMKPADTDSILTELAASSPEAKTLIDKLYQPNGRVSREALMGLSDIIEKRTGLTFKVPDQKGLLNATPVSKGVLTQTGSPEVNITNYVRGLSDDEVKAIIGKDADTAGRVIKNPRKFATGKLEKLLEDARNGVEIDPQDLALLKDRGLM